MNFSPFTISKLHGGRRVDKVIAALCPSAPESMIQKWIRTGQVRLDGGRIKGRETVKAGQQLRLPPQAQNFMTREIPPQPPHLLAAFKDWIVYQDDALLVLNKPGGIPTQAGTNRHVSIDRIVKEIFANDAAHDWKLCHRIDQETSGCLIFANGAANARSIGEQLQDRSVEKTYLALCSGKLAEPEGIIDAPLLKDANQKPAIVMVRHDGQTAQTAYKVLEQAGDNMLVQAKPLTGRMHQIRVHLAHLGAPLVGDEKYGGQPWRGGTMPDHFYLHATQMKLTHPETKQPIVLNAPLPDYWLENAPKLQLNLNA